MNRKYTVNLLQLPSIISKLRTLLVGEPKLEKEMTSEVSEDQLRSAIKKWVRDVRELSVLVERHDQ